MVSLAEASMPEASQLIDQLISPNPKPITGDEDANEGPNYKTPQGFDRVKQELVYKARSELVRLGPAAFPFLIERWDDKRYCLTTENALSGYCHNRTVGEECRTIIYDQLQPFGYFQQTDERRSHPMRPDYTRTFLSTAEDAKKWWEKHKDKSLYAMQLMVVDWIIAEEAKKPDDFTRSERSYLKQFRNDLVKSGKPVEWGNYYSAERDFKVESSDATKDETKPQGDKDSD
jgi:hypothetical protein